jgi:hypothetical protein
MRLALDIDFWDESIGAFEPAKVIRQVCRVFPQTEVDRTDHQEVRLCRELEMWTQSNLQEATRETRESLIRQSKDLYRTNGPTYYFHVPFGSTFRVKGWARRLSVGFNVPDDLPKEFRNQLLRFLQSVRMGEPKLDTSDL